MDLLMEKKSDGAFSSSFKADGKEIHISESNDTHKVNVLITDGGTINSNIEFGNRKLVGDYFKIFWRVNLIWREDDEQA